MHAVYHGVQSQQHSLSTKERTTSSPDLPGHSHPQGDLHQQQATPQSPLCQHGLKHLQGPHEVECSPTGNACLPQFVQVYSLVQIQCLHPPCEFADKCLAHLVKSCKPISSTVYLPVLLKSLTLDDSQMTKTMDAHPNDMLEF